MTTKFEVVGRPLSRWRVNEVAVDRFLQADRFLEPGVSDGVSLRKVRDTAGLWCDAVNRWNTDLAEPRDYRVIGDIYRIECPEKDYPDHLLYQHDPRNSSPTRKKEPALLKAFWDYRELNESSEPLQSNYLRADNDNYAGDPDHEEGDGPERPERDAEAELEIRPSPEEMEERWSVPTVEYESRQVGLLTGPRLSDCGYCMAPTSPLIREMKIPVAGDIKRSALSQDDRKAYEQLARRVLRGKGVTASKKNIGDFVATMNAPISRFADLRFASIGARHHRRGEVTHYCSNGRWFPSKDQYGTPYGPKSQGSDVKFWKPSHPRTGKNENMKKLSRSDRAKQIANRNNPIAPPMTPDEALEAFRLKLEANGKPVPDNRQCHLDGLPWKTESADELQFGYAFGKTYAEERDSPEPLVDVVERRETLAFVNGRLSPQARRVANMLVQTDDTETLAQNYADVGAALWTRRKSASARTLMRHGQEAIDDAAKEINTLLQELAA